MIPPTATTASLLSSHWLALSLFTIPDPIRDGLDAKVSHFSHLVGWSTIAVAVGVLLEGIELVHAGNEWRKRKRREKSESVQLEELRQFIPIGSERRKLSTSHPEEPPWAKLILRVGLILVVIGVVGEWRYGSKLEDAHDAVHIYDLNKIREANEKAGAAVESAKTAQDEASKARERADAADIAAGKAQRKADAATASAAHIRELEAQLNTEVNEADLILSASSSGQMLRIGLFNSLSVFREKRENLSVMWRRGARPDTILFAQKLSTAFSSFGWHISAPSGESTKLPTEPGVTIYNKWSSLQRPYPGGGAGFGSLADDASGLQPAVWGDGHPGMSGQQPILLSRLAVALNATLESDSTLPADSLILVVGDAK